MPFWGALEAFERFCFCPVHTVLEASVLFALIDVGNFS